MNDLERIEARLVPEPNTGCYLWEGADGGSPRQSHGKIRIGGVLRRVTHAVWEAHKGPVPPETPFVCHKCDTPACANIDHLFLGTNADNVRDKVSKGRQSKHAGMTAWHAEMARELYAQGEPQQAIAKAMGVSQTIVSRMIRRIGYT